METPYGDYHRDLGGGGVVMTIEFEFEREKIIFSAETNLIFTVQRDPKQKSLKVRYRDPKTNRYKTNHYKAGAAFWLLMAMANQRGLIVLGELE